MITGQNAGYVDHETDAKASHKADDIKFQLNHAEKVVLAFTPDAPM